MILINIDRNIINSCCFALNKDGIINAIKTNKFKRNNNIDKLGACISYIIRKFSNTHPYIKDSLYLFKNDNSILKIFDDKNMIKNTKYYIESFQEYNDFDPIRGLYYFAKGFHEFSSNMDETLSNAFFSRALEEFQRSYSLISDELIKSHIQYILCKIYTFKKKPRLARLSSEKALEINNNNINAKKANIFLTEAYHPMKAVQEYLLFLSNHPHDLDSLLRLFFLFERFSYTEKAKEIVKIYVEAQDEYLKNNIDTPFFPEKMIKYIK